jgi:hypothetical protein
MAKPIPAPELTDLPAKPLAKPPVLMGKPAALPPPPDPTKVSTIPFQTRVKQLNTLWEKFTELSHHLGCTVITDAKGVTLVETHRGYVLDARGVALEIREMMNDFRRVWPPN